MSSILRRLACVLIPVMREKLRQARLVAPTGTFHVTPCAWAVAPGDEGWLRQLDAFVARIKRDGRLLAAARRHGLEPIVIER